MSKYKITKIVRTPHDIDFYFEHTGDEPFTSDEFTKGTRTRGILKTIEDCILALEEGEEHE